MTAEIGRLSHQVAALQKSMGSLPNTSLTSQNVPTEIARLRLSLRRARNVFRRLGHGSFALSGFILVAFLAALFAAKLTVLPGYIAVTAALFLGIVGFLFYMQADSIDLADKR